MKPQYRIVKRDGLRPDGYPRGYQGSRPMVSKGLFVGYGAEYRCCDCVPVCLDIGGDGVTVWEELSDGWTAPVVCGCCNLSIPVIVDGPEQVTWLVSKIGAYLENQYGVRLSSVDGALVEILDGALSRSGSRYLDANTADQCKRALVAYLVDAKLAHKDDADLFAGRKEVSE